MKLWTKILAGAAGMVAGGLTAVAIAGSGNAQPVLADSCCGGCDTGCVCCDGSDCTCDDCCCDVEATPPACDLCCDAE